MRAAAPGTRGHRGRRKRSAPPPQHGDLQLTQGITLLESLWNTSPARGHSLRVPPHALGDALGVPCPCPWHAAGSTLLLLVLLLPCAQPEGLHQSLNSYINIFLGNPSEENNINRTDCHFLCGCLSNGNQMMFIFKKMKMPIKK